MIHKTLAAVSLLMLAPAQAHAGTATSFSFGNESNDNTGGGDGKLDLYTVAVDATLVTIEARLEATTGDPISWLIYEEDQTGTYNLVWTGTTNAAGDGSGWEEISPSYALTGGSSYAIGPHFTDNMTYYWSDTGTSYGWITHEGAAYAMGASAPSTLDDATVGGHAYMQRLWAIVSSTGDDNDNDGWGTFEGDCDDNNAAINPDATEVCDGADTNCDGITDNAPGSEWYPDSDGDGHGNIDGNPVISCTAPQSWVSSQDDCADNNDSVYPGAQEYCDGYDNDCDTTVDEDCIDRPDVDTGDSGGADSGGADSGGADTDQDTDGGTQDDDLNGGCGCNSTPSSAAGLGVIALLALVGRRRES